MDVGDERRRWGGACGVLWEGAKHRKEGAGVIAVWRRIGGRRGEKRGFGENPGSLPPFSPGEMGKVCVSCRGWVEM